jgi:hypothetical protein
MAHKQTFGFIPALLLLLVMLPPKFVGCIMLDDQRRVFGKSASSDSRNADFALVFFRLISIFQIPHLTLTNYPSGINE